MVGVLHALECTSGSIRLVNGPNEYSGRVEVCMEQAWGTVCDDLWTNEDAMVACSQLGFSRFGMHRATTVLALSSQFNLTIFLCTGAVAQGMAAFGAGTGLIHLDDLMCTGDESSLFFCPFDPIHNCAHSEDAGVICVRDRKRTFFVSVLFTLANL